MSTVNLNVSTLDAASISDWLRSKTVTDDTVASFLSERTVSNASSADVAPSSVMVVTSLNHTEGASPKEINQNARREFLSFIKASCGLPDSAPIDKLPDGVQKAMKCTGFIGLFKKGDWVASNGRPLTARRIRAVMTAIEESAVQQSVDEKIGGLVREAVQPHVDKGWISRDKFDALCQRLSCSIERRFKENLPGELEGTRDPNNLADMPELVRTFCEIAEDGLDEMYVEVERRCEKSVMTVYPDESVRKTKIKNGALWDVVNEIKRYVTSVAFLQVIRRNPALAKSWAYNPDRVEFADRRIHGMASLPQADLKGWKKETPDRFGFLEECLELVMTLMAGGESRTLPRE